VTVGVGLATTTAVGEGIVATTAVSAAPGTAPAVAAAPALGPVVVPLLVAVAAIVVFVVIVYVSLELAKLTYQKKKPQIDVGPRSPWPVGPTMPTDPWVEPPEGVIRPVVPPIVPPMGPEGVVDPRATEVEKPVADESGRWEICPLQPGLIGTNCTYRCPSRVTITVPLLTHPNCPPRTTRRVS